jgi:pimeloyl-ACP methyl ester carboxylesterase
MATMILCEKDLGKSEGLRRAPGFPYVGSVSELITSAIEIPTSDDHPVCGDLYLPASGSARSIVLLCHGLKGYRAWGFLPYVADRLREAGIAALSLDMSLNGTLPAPDDDATTRGDASSPERNRYVRPVLFEQNTLAREHRDIEYAVRFVAGGGLKEHIPTPLLIGLFGHSRGAIAATLNAIECPQVQALCTWSAIDDPDDFTPRQKERWRREGVYAFTESTGGTRLGIGLDYLNDLEEHHEFYLMRERVRELRVPHLTVHGQADMVVSVECAFNLHHAEKQLRDKQLVVLQTGHTFGIPYPEPRVLTQPSAALKRATDETVSWFEAHLQGD